jgi:CHC2 zinc finger/Toprim-like
MGENDRDPHRRHRVDWKAERETIDLAAVATAILGPAPGRRGEHGRRLWWPCPFHPDRNPSFCVDPGKGWWRCFGCGENGDAAALVMRLNPGMTFPEAVAYLTGGATATRPGKAPGRPRDERPVGPPPEPSGLPEADALALVADAEARLWSPEGADALAYLTGPRRCLSPATIRAARLGWTPGVMVPTRDGDRSFRALGVVIPWFHGDRLALVKIRQPDDRRPKYAEAFRDPARLVCYPSPATIRPGRPLVLVEGEFDALVLGQELAGLAAVVTLGSASSPLTDDILTRLLSAPRWFIATDADGPGDKAAARWPDQARRVRPPEPFKDWTEARQGGVDLRLWWWRDILPGVGRPPLFTWDDLAGWRWGPAVDDPTPGVVVP